MNDDISRPYGMFGFFRFAVGLMAVTGYLVAERYALVQQANIIFIMLAGYTAAYQLQRVYLPMQHGVRRYFLDRALRVYPVYWVVLAPAFLLTLLDGGVTTAQFYNFNYVLPYETPDSVVAYVGNLSLVGLTGLNGILLEPVYVSPAWGLSMLLLCWLLAPLLMMRRDVRVFVLCVSIYYTLSVLALSYGAEVTNKWVLVAQHGLFSGVLPMLLGIYLYLLRESRRFKLPDGGLGWGVVLGIVYLLFQRNFGFDPERFGAWLSVLAALCIMVALCRVRAERTPVWLQKADKTLGGIAWPMVMLAVPMKALVAYMLPETMSINEQGKLFNTENVMLFNLALPLAVAGGALVYWYVERPVTELRRNLRAQAQPSATTPT